MPYPKEGEEKMLSVTWAQYAAFFVLKC